ncbi:MAG: Com family DNA-binding transcriptional regulator [Syntrophomonas sp.]|nr:Com family DNA-binding transcriptional regulator [Syntrophomonas sp.]
MQDFRCEKCKKLLGKYLGCKRLEIKCPRCGMSNCLIENLVYTDQVNSHSGREKINGSVFKV